MKKIAILVPDLSLGGGQRSAVSTAELLSRNNKVDIVIFSDEKRVFETDLRVRNLSCPKKDSFLGKTYNIYKRRQQFRKLCAQEKYDLVISFLESANLCAFLSDRKNSVLTMHLSPKMLTRFDQLILRHVLSRSENIVAVSDGLKKHLGEMGHDLRNITVINNPICAESIRAQAGENNFNNTKRFIVSAARLTWQKGYDVMINAFRKSQASSTHDLIIIGAGEDLDSLKSMLEPDDNVYFIGEMSNPFPVIKAADMFLMTSRFEAFPMVLLETLALEKAIIAYDCPTGLTDIIENNENGVLVENHNFDELVKAIDRVTSSEIVRSELTKNCLASIEQYSFDSIESRWESYIQNHILK